MTQLVLPTPTNARQRRRNKLEQVAIEELHNKRHHQIPRRYTLATPLIRRCSPTHNVACFPAVTMSHDPLPPIAPARVKALLLPAGKIKSDRFASFVKRLQSEHVVQLPDVTPDGRPNRSKWWLDFPSDTLLPLRSATRNMVSCSIERIFRG